MSDSTSGRGAKFIVPAIHEMGKRNSYLTGSRPITVEEAGTIAEDVWSIEKFDDKKREISRRIEALVAA